MGPRTRLDGCGKSRPHRDSDPRTIRPLTSRSTDVGAFCVVVNRPRAVVLLHLTFQNEGSTILRNVGNH